MDVLRAIKNRIKRQGNKGRKRKPGRPTKVSQKRRESRKKRTKKEAAFLWGKQHLIVRKKQAMTKEEKEIVKHMIKIAPEIETLRRFNAQFYSLFERRITQRQAHYRRRRMIAAVLGHLQPQGLQDNPSKAPEIAAKQCGA